MEQLPLQFATNSFDENNTTNVDVLEIRGEVVLPQSIFQQLRMQQQEVSISNTTTDNKTSSSSQLNSFANARNAASGILLRKEITNKSDNNNINTDEAASISKELRQKLRFYAYDIVVERAVKATADTDAYDAQNITMLDGVTSRKLLRSLGFSTPEPISTTTLKLAPPTHNTTIDNKTDVNSKTKIAAPSHLQWNETDIFNMLEYHSELQRHREHEDDNNETTTTSKRSDHRLQQKHRNWQWGDYDMDGCVHKISEHAIREMLGSSNRAPRWAVAHKFQITAVVTELWGIDVQVGRTGALTPVAILKPIALAGGVTVQRATMHNFGHMRQMLLGNAADANEDVAILKNTSVMVRRAGDVIPQVVSRADGDQQVAFLKSKKNKTTTRQVNSDKFISLAPPSKCPACGSAVSFDSTKGDDSSSVGQVLRCRGPSLLCPPRAIGALQHAYSRDALDITGLSLARIQQLVDANYIRMPGDVFTLAKEEAKLKELADELDGWGAKSAKNMAAAANRVASEGVSLSRFIYSLGIRHAGVHSSALLAAVYGSVDEFLKDIEKASHAVTDGNIDTMLEEMPELFACLREDNEATKGIGPSLLASLLDFSKEKTLVDAARELSQNIRVFDDPSYGKTLTSSSSTEEESEDVSSEPKPLSGLSVVFTGTIADMSRSAAQKVAKEMGAKSTPNSVSRTTGLVVSGAKGGKKRDQAKNLGVKLIDGDEFLQMVKEFRDNNK